MSVKYIDIGANLTDSMFRGIYGGTQKHNSDLNFVLQRSWLQGLQKIIITVGSLEEADEALALAKTDERLFVTMGCHPTRCEEFHKNPLKYYEGLREKILSYPSKVVAIGECGLDYDRLHFCDKEIQKVYFEKQLHLSKEFNLPLFLHCRNAHEDFMKILEKNCDTLNLTSGGVVHSFDGRLDDALKILNVNNFYIGLNGCSLKTQNNLNVVAELPIEKIMLETDSPWCSIRPSHAGHKFVQTIFPTVKRKEKWTADTLIDGRCEPCQITQVLEVIAHVKQRPINELANVFYNNTAKLFFKEVFSAPNVPF